MTTWWSLSCAKFGWNRCGSFDNVKLQYFACLAWKRLFTNPKIGVLEISPLKWGAISTKPSKGTPLHKCALFEPSSAKIRQRVWPVGEFPKKRYKFKKSFYFSHLPRSPHGRICTKFGTAVGAVDAITCTNFWRSVKGCGFCGGRKLPSPIDEASRC